MSKEAFGAQLAEWLKKTELEKKLLAKYIDKGPSSITGYLKGDNQPGKKSLALLALVFSGQDVVKPIRRLSSLRKVADVRELVDWVGLIGYSAEQLREAVYINWN